MNSNPQQRLANDEDAPEMPTLLKYISIGASLALLALSWATAWVWFPDTTLGKVVALLLFVAAFPAISTFVVLEGANYLSGGELKRTGRLKR